MHCVGAALLGLGACSGGAPENAQIANEALNAAATVANAAETPESQPLPPVATNAAAGEAGQDSYTWTFNPTAGRDPSSGASFPNLIYGSRGNDEIVINFQCRQPGIVTLLQLRQGVGESRNEPIQLASGSRQVQLDVTLGPDGADGNTPAVAQLPIDHPLLVELRRTGQLGVTNDGRSRRADAVDAAEKATVERFFASCQRL